MEEASKRSLSEIDRCRSAPTANGEQVDLLCMHIRGVEECNMELDTEAVSLRRQQPQQPQTQKRVFVKEPAPRIRAAASLFGGHCDVKPSASPTCQVAAVDGSGCKI